MTVKERGFARMSEDAEATIWRLGETTRVADLAATNRLRQMRRLLMHEKRKTGSESSASTVLKRAPRWMKNAFAKVPAPCQIRSSIETWLLVDADVHRTNLHLKGKWMSKACGWKLFFRNQRRHSVIHHRAAPLSIQGQRNPERRHGRPRSVRGRRNPEHREPLLKPVKMVFEFKLHKHGAGVCFASSSARRRGRQRERNCC